MFRKDLLKRHLRERYHVTLTDGTSFSGVLVNTGDLNFEFAEVRAGEHKAEGRLFIDRLNVEYLQSVVTHAAD